MRHPQRLAASRRQFLKKWGGLAAASLCGVPASGQRGSNDNQAGKLEISHIMTFNGADLRAISPDGRYLCLYTFNHLENFVRKWSYDGGNTSNNDDVLRVFELRTGNATYATQLRSMVVSANFFRDSRRLYAETFPMTEAEGGRATVFQQAVVDLTTRSLDDRLCALGRSYVALSGSFLLGHEFSLQTSRPTSLLIANLPDYRETLRVPFAVEQEPAHYGRPIITGRGVAYGHDTTPVVSSDRKTVVHGTGHSIACRRTSDLGVLWTHPIEPDYLGAWMLDLTPDGSRIAAAIVGGSSAADRDRFYIGVYDGGNGSVVARLPLNGREGISISPDGKLLAASAQTLLPNGRVEPTVKIYDIASGSQVGNVSHPAVSVTGFGNSGKGAIGSQFTPDGKYLITSGVGDTMVWTIQR